MKLVESNSANMTLGNESFVRLVLKKGIKAQGASSTTGGQALRIFLDDLTYTAIRPAP